MIADRHEPLEPDRKKSFYSDPNAKPTVVTCDPAGIPDQLKLACEDPKVMLEFLRHEWPVILRGEASDRKLRLLAIACMRRTADLFRLSESGQCVELAEQSVIVPMSIAEVIDARDGALSVCGSSKIEPSVADYAACFLFGDAGTVALDAIERALRFQTPDANGFLPESTRDMAEQVPLLRDTFGNPFRKVKFKKKWRTDTALTLARQMYESRDFGAMPILADALQDAGCDNEDILDHCRGIGTHVRGCWVVDLVLGKG